MTYREQFDALWTLMHDVQADPVVRQQAYLDSLAVNARAAGEHYGYPPCCIEAFVAGLLAVAPAWEDHLHLGQGHVLEWAVPGPVVHVHDPHRPPEVQHIRCAACIRTDRRS